MPNPVPFEACSGRQALFAAEAKAAAEDAAGRIRADVALGLSSFDDTFVEALGGGFLADDDDRRIEHKYAARPALLRVKRQRNQRARAAQRALHCLYNKLQNGAAMTVEEKALAEHARDLCEGYIQIEAEQRERAAGW